MSRSGYSDACDGPELALWRGAVDRATRGRRGQAFLREMLAALDALPEKRLCLGELKNEDGDVCAIGAVCVARGVDTAEIDYEDPDEVAKAMGIARALAAEIAFENDDQECYWRTDTRTPEQRWQRMRAWVAARILPEGKTP